MNTTALDADSAAALRAAVSFCKTLAIDILKISSEGVVGIDETPTIALFVTTTTSKYTGPELYLNRLRVLDTRLAGTITVTTNTADKPVGLKIQNNKTTYDHRLASVSQGKRLPSAFKGDFSTKFEIVRSDFKSILDGARNVGGDVVNLQSKSGKLVALSNKEGETFTYSVMDLQTSDQFSYNYSLDHLTAIDKVLDIAQNVKCNITPRGQLMISVVTDTVLAQFFILDVKNR